ncbi:MAG: SpoIIE family protein phosphatase [Coriobacteriales bacterium]|jgi:sigma-B regulation protein RsbU (phosphoserine phosphatase)|nr:SpoIIE family protein phosphatase [Coriobacteriales bacterium]
MSETGKPRPPGLLAGLVDRLLGAKGGSISKKLLRAFLIVSAGGMITAIVVVELMFQSVLGVTEQSNLDIGETAALSSVEALTGTVLADTETLAQAKADVIDESIGRLAGDLKTFADYVEGLYARPGDYRDVPFEHLRNVPADTLALQWALTPGMVSESHFDVRDLEEAGVRDETYLLGNIEHVGKALMSDEPSISSLYITTENGINIGYDSFAEQKWSVDTIDLRERDWYLGATRNDGLYLSDTYRDSFERGLNITMAMPVKGPDGSFRGVVGADINISDLENIVKETNAGMNGYAVLLNGDTIISAPGLNEDNEDDLAFFLGSEAATILGQMEGEPSGSGETEAAGTSGDGRTHAFFAVWGPVEATGWQLVILVPQTDVTAPSVELHSDITAMTNAAAASASDRIMLANVILIAVAVLLVTVSVVTSRFISRKITRPITKLSKDVDGVGTGDLDYRSDIDTGDEIEALSHSFERMTGQLKDYISELSLATAEKERISTELNVAAHIQASMLPNTFPAFPDSDEFDIFATMDAAKMIGGDFYDFFFMDGGAEGERLVVVMADVSGKGIPAALFMVVARTLIKSNAQMGKSPGEVFGIVNDLLSENNDASMFVTAFMGYLDLASGGFSYVNAGHTPTLVSRSGAGFEKLEMDPGFVLGAFPGLAFEERQTVLAAGDRLFLYTDGVTEAASPSLELFSEQRLLRVLDEGAGTAGGGGADEAAGGGTPMAELLAHIKREIDAFAADAEQADDITMLALELKRLTGDEAGAAAAVGGGVPDAPSPGAAAAGASGDRAAAGAEEGGTGAAADDGATDTSELRVAAEDERLPEVLAFVESAFRSHGFTESQIKKVDIAAEEVFVNVAHYAYAEDAAQPKGDVAVTLGFDPGTGAATLSFKDGGAPFNPLERPAPDVTLDASERAIGGLGIHMVVTMMDSVEYAYENGCNVLTLTLARLP